MLDDLRAGFAQHAKIFEMETAVFDAADKQKVVIMVSRFGHCRNDLLYRRRIGALPIEIAAVVSNHMDDRKPVVNHDIPLHCGTVNKDNDPDAKARI